jgi:PmbA protein
MNDFRTLQDAAAQALDAMRAAGFEHAQVTASTADLNELNAGENEPTLLRSADARKLSLAGIVDARMASTELATFAADTVAASVAALAAEARAAPQDAAYAVSAGQRGHIEQGPQEPDFDALADGVADLLAFRASHAPTVLLRHAICSHHLKRWQTLTTGGSQLGGSLGWYGVIAYGAAREGDRTSSMGGTSGYTHDLRGRPMPEQFGIGPAMQDMQRMVRTRPWGAKATGDVVLAPQAVEDLLGWLLGQLGDAQLIAGSSLYRERVGQAIAAPAFTLKSRFDAPGVAAVSADGFVALPVTLVEQGVLRHLAPTLYGSRKTGIAHRPLSTGWDVEPGTQDLPTLIGGVRRGALVGRFSMGLPAANGDFSAVIKNSFAIENGEIGQALAETMITGNVAQMLRDITGISRERLDGEGTRLPWIRVAGLHFS